MGNNVLDFKVMVTNEVIVLDIGEVSMAVNKSDVNGFVNMPSKGLSILFTENGMNEVSRQMKFIKEMDSQLHKDICDHIIIKGFEVNLYTTMPEKKVEDNDTFESTLKDISDKDNQLYEFTEIVCGLILDNDLSSVILLSNQLINNGLVIRYMNKETCTAKLIPVYTSEEGMTSIVNSLGIKGESFTSVEVTYDCANDKLVKVN